MDNSLAGIVNSAKSILVCLPTKPYFDQVAAALSLYLSLSVKGNTEVYSPTPMSVGFNRLIGVNKIRGEVGNKDLAITFPNYKAEDIEKVSYDIENGEFKLTVVPKDGKLAPQKDQVSMSYSGVSADLVILIGGGKRNPFSDSFG